MTDRNRLEVVEYRAWEKGSAFANGLLAGQGEASDYQAMNLQVYQSKLLGPRPWLRRMSSPTGPLSASLNSLRAGGLHVFRDSLNGYQILVLDNGATVYASRWPGGTVWSSTALVHTGSSGPQIGGESAYYSLSDSVYSAQINRALAFLGPDDTWNPNTSATATVTWPVGAAPTAVVLWKGRAFGFQDTSNVFRVWYSDASAPTTFTSASQFFDVGTAPIIAAVPLRDALMFATDDGKWWALTGSSPSSWSLRELGEGRVPHYGNRVSVYNNAAWFWSRYAAGISVVTPDKVDAQTLDFIRPTIDKSTSFVPFGNALPIVPLKPVVFHESSAVVFPFIGQGSASGAAYDAPYLGFQSIDLLNGAPTWSRYWVADTEASAGYGMDDTSNVSGARIVGCAEMSNILLVAVDEQRLPNNGTNTVGIYMRSLSLDRPSKSSDPYAAGVEELAGVNAQDGDGSQMSAGVLHLRQYAPPPGNRVRVRRVLADVRYWGGSDYQDPAISLRLVNESGTLETIAHTAADHNITTSSTGDSGMPGRIEWWPTSHPSSMFMQVQFVGVIGVAFNKVLVEYEVFPE